MAKLFDRNKFATASFRPSEEHIEWLKNNGDEANSRFLKKVSKFRFLITEVNDNNILMQIQYKAETGEEDSPFMLIEPENIAEAPVVIASEDGRSKTLYISLKTKGDKDGKVMVVPVLLTPEEDVNKIISRLRELNANYFRSKHSF